jgi:hypothetical protein
LAGDVSLVGGVLALCLGQSGLGLLCDPPWTLGEAESKSFEPPSVALGLFGFDGEHLRGDASVSLDGMGRTLGLFS